ncbi:MAG: hypothetical protein ACRDHY_09145 [Anaerolineales bacterium]
MNANRLLLAGALLVAVFAPLGAASAKGVVEITISGPGLTGEVEVTDQATIEALAQLGGAGVPTNLLPALGEEFYVIRVGIGDETGKVFATNVFHYYPDPAGGSGYVLFSDVEGGFSDSEGRWHRAPSAWDGALRGFLLAQGVELKAASAPASQLQAEAAAAAPQVANRPAVILGLLSIAAGAAGAIGLRRSRLRAAANRRG